MLIRRKVPKLFKISIKQWFGAVKNYDENKDYYKILEVNKDATDAQIKSSFFRLAKKYHPDRNPSMESKFKQINEAYTVLSNKKTKTEYEQARSYASTNPNPSKPFYQGYNPYQNEQTQQTYQQNKRSSQGSPFQNQNPYKGFYNSNQQSRNPYRQNYDPFQQFFRNQAESQNQSGPSGYQQRPDQKYENPFDAYNKFREDYEQKRKQEYKNYRKAYEERFQQEQRAAEEQLRSFSRFARMGLIAGIITAVLMMMFQPRRHYVHSEYIYEPYSQGNRQTRTVQYDYYGNPYQEPHHSSSKHQRV